MKKTVTLVVLIIVLLGACIGGYVYYDANRDFTPWMERTEFNAAMLKAVRGGNAYVSIVEGRLSNGVKQWRARVAPVPSGMQVDGHWWIDMNEKFYNETVADMTVKQKYDLLKSQFFLDQKGVKTYQAAFRKTSLREQKRP